MVAPEVTGVAGSEQTGSFLSPRNALHRSMGNSATHVVLPDG